MIISIGENKLAKFLIKNGADVNAAGNHLGFTPLHCFYYHGSQYHPSREIIALLIENGANINTLSSDEFMHAPLDFAVMTETGNCKRNLLRPEEQKLMLSIKKMLTTNLKQKRKMFKQILW